MKFVIWQLRYLRYLATWEKRKNLLLGYLAIWWKNQLVTWLFIKLVLGYLSNSQVDKATLGRTCILEEITSGKYFITTRDFLKLYFKVHHDEYKVDELLKRK